jgi:hypothetical protein
MSTAPFVFLQAGPWPPKAPADLDPEGPGGPRPRWTRRDLDRGPGLLVAAAGNVYAGGMCRNIRTLHNFEPPATHQEVEASALQYVRKISGFTKPSKANEAAFAAAIQAVTEVSLELLGQLTTNAPPKNREEEAAKARARSAARYAA